MLREPRLARIVAERAGGRSRSRSRAGGCTSTTTTRCCGRATAGTTGLKTGYTDAAGRCLVATARRGPIKLGVVLLHSPDPGKQAMQLLDRGFRASSPRERVRRSDEPLARRLPAPPRRRARRARGASPRWSCSRITLLTGSDAAEQPRGGADAERAQATPTPEPPAELPRGGRRILPDFRVVAYYGAPQDTQLGALGIGTPAQAARKLERQAKGTRASRARCCRRWS